MAHLGNPTQRITTGSNGSPVRYVSDMFSLAPEELVGYLASALVVISLTMTSVVRLRTISLVGSVIFVVYGVLIGSVPIVITNAAIAVINVWFLRSELGMKRDLGASEVPCDVPFLADFVQHHLADIERFQPGFTMPNGPEAFALVLLRDGLPAGALIGRRHGEDLEILLDHVVKPYRDSRLGAWLFGAGSRVFRTAGFTRLITAPGTEQHRSYLESVGFRRVGERYELAL
jgi:hypothetical protein